MNPFFQIVIIAYLFFAVPVLLGVFEAAVFRKEKKCVSEIISNGYLIMFAMFWAAATLCVRQGQELSVLARVWCIIAVVSSLAGLILGRKILENMLAECRMFWQSKKYLLLFMALISVVVSIGFTKPSVGDITVLLVDTSVKTNSIYGANPYSGDVTGMIESTHAASPIEMLYAVGIQLTGADTQIVIYDILPVILLIVFFLTVWRVSASFFEQKEQRVWFEMITIIIYWMTTYMEGRRLVTGIFLNSWNGLTLLSCIIMPLAFSMLIQWMKQAEAGVKNIPAKLEKGVWMVVLILAAQLTNNKGGFYILLMLFLSAAVIVVKGGYTYVIKTGCFKKRI